MTIDTAAVLCFHVSLDDGKNTDVASGTSRCLEKDMGLSASFARCNGINVASGAKKCSSECVSDSSYAGCRACVLKNCGPAFYVCTGA